MRRPSLRPAVVAAVATAVLAACGSSSSGRATADPSSASGGGRSLTVFAAASLTESFSAIGRRFEAAHPGVEVTFSFGPSSGLATQITQGAPADVFAAASAAPMDRLVAAKAAGTPTTFAENSMEIAVPPDDPAAVDSVDDLAKPGVKVVLCAPDVPCGEVAAQVFANAKVTVQPVSEEVDVKAALTKVELGEADAGVVYVTDVLAAGDKVKGVEIPGDLNASTGYPIATTTASRNAVLAQQFVDFVLSPDGAEVLAAAGFATP